MLAKFRKYWFIKVGERSEPRKFWKKNCVFNHKICANSEIRTFALPKSGGGGTNPLVPPPTFESGEARAPLPPSPFSYALDGSSDKWSSVETVNVTMKIVLRGNFLVKFKVIPRVHTRVFPFLKILYGVVGFRKDFFQIWNKNDYFQDFWVSQSVLGVPDL